MVVMEELFELKTAIKEQRYLDALNLVEKMEEMSRDDKINKIDSFSLILFLHLIKQHAEKRTTRLWDLSIHHAVRQICRTNKRRKSGGYYLNEDELSNIIEDAYSTALKMAALEAFEGQYTAEQLSKQVVEATIKHQALELIWAEMKTD